MLPAILMFMLQLLLQYYIEQITTLYCTTITFSKLKERGTNNINTMLFIDYWTL